MLFAAKPPPNAVGFQDIQGGANKKLIQGCQFMQISEDPINLQEILFKVDGEIPENGCDIWWWDNNLEGGGTGFVDAQFNYWWYDESDESLADNDYCGEGPCWTDDGDLPTLIKKTFVPGEGFYAQPYAQLDNPTLTIAGSVFGADDTTSESRSIDFLAANKKQMCSNPFPTELNLQDVIFTVDGEIPENGCDIWWWDNNLPGGGTGFVEAQFNYWWYDESDESLADNDYCGEGPCWTDDGDLPTLIKKTFAPGAGFYAQPYAQLDNPKLFFPSPFVKK